VWLSNAPELSRGAIVELLNQLLGAAVGFNSSLASRTTTPTQLELQFFDPILAPLMLDIEQGILWDSQCFASHLDRKWAPALNGCG
jgi:hypothetical protein